MHFTRRGLLASAVAWLVGPPASAGSDDGTPERSELVAQAREVLLGFDVQDLLLNLRRELDLPQRWDREIVSLFLGFDTHGGLRGMQRLSEDAVFMARVEALSDRARRDLGLKLRLRRHLMRAPDTADGLGPLIERAAELVGLDLPAVRRAAAQLPDGMLLIVGPPADVPELMASLAREPFVRLLELVHGRRAREWVFGAPRRALYEALLDPSTRVVCTVGHGTWDELSLSGFAGLPDANYRKLLARVRSDPRKMIPALISGNRWGLGLAFVAQPLREADLAALIDAWAPDPEARRAILKDRVVRYTCGDARWRIDPPVAAELLPPEIAAHLSVAHGGIAGATPRTDPERWRPALEAWLVGKAIAFEPAPAFGTCLVADPAHTHGYEGISWVADFLETPIPPATPTVAISPRPPPTGG